MAQLLHMAVMERRGGFLGEKKEEVVQHVGVGVGGLHRKCHVCWWAEVGRRGSGEVVVIG